MATGKQGYYTRDTGDGDVYHYYMGDEPPLEQYILRGGRWVPLEDGWYLMDLGSTGPESQNFLNSIQSTTGS